MRRPTRQNGAQAILTHPDRVLFPEIGATKRDIATYYESVADWILPHLRDRPLTLKQCAPDVDHCRYLRHSGPRTPPGVRTIEIQQQHKRGTYMIVDSLPGLLALVQRNFVEYHTWQATAADIERPDRIVIDLDPGENVPPAKLVAAARTAHGVLDALVLRSWLKTTGGNGLHVVVPFRPEHDWDTCFAFARRVATMVMQRDPSLYTITTAHREARRDQILIDYLRNARSASAVAAFSLRARPTATVSVPLAWDELTERFDSRHWTIRNVPGRLQRMKTDPWKDFWRTRQRLGRAVGGPQSGPRR